MQYGMKIASSIAMVPWIHQIAQARLMKLKVDQLNPH